MVSAYLKCYPFKYACCVSPSLGNINTIQNFAKHSFGMFCELAHNREKLQKISAKSASLV